MGTLACAPRTLSALLRGDSFNDEVASLCGLLTNWLNSLVCGRVFPVESLLGTVKCNHHKISFRRTAFERRHLTTPNQIPSPKGFECPYHLRGISFERSGVSHINF